ncbi:MAG: outer membrane protein assembly factor BamA [Deltaproteobacteria bacterium]
MQLKEVYPALSRYRPYISILVFFLLASLLAPLSARAQSSLKVLVLPFEINSPTDASAFRRDVMEGLASALDRSGAEIVGIEAVKEMMLNKGVSRFTEEEAKALSKTVRYDFVILGSVARNGETAEANWRVLEAGTMNEAALYKKTSASEAEVISLVRLSGAEVFEKMFAVIKARPAVKSGIIDRIAVVGNKRVDTAAIMKKLTSRASEPFSPDDVKEDIRAIFSTGFFDDVSADLSDTTSGKVLTFIVKEMPFVRKVEFRGNSELKNEKVREALSMKENTALDRVLMNENAEKIKALYAEEGFYLTTVKPLVESDGLEAKVIFEINEGPEVKVKRITFIGNSHFDDSRLKGFMTTAEKGFFSVLTSSGKFNEYVFHNDLAMIMGRYFDDGFINADILDQRVLLSEDKKWFSITVAVSEGDQFRVGAVDVSGEILTTKEELIEKFKLSKGDVFNRSKLTKWIDAVTEVYGDKGYAYAEIKPVTDLDTVNKTIDITLDIKKNELAYIERIDITGNLKTRDKVIRREIELGEGDLFSTSSMKRSRNNLRRLGYFEDVRVKQAQGSAGDKIKLDVDVKERPTGSLSLGFGYSSVDKLIGTASISQANFMGTGLKLDLSGTMSASSSKYVLGFTEPWLFDKPISAGFDLYKTERQYPDFTLRKNGFDVRLGFPITNRYTRGYVTYRLEDVHIYDVAEVAAAYIKDQQGTSTESSIKGQIKRDTRDDAFFPSEGSVENLSVEFAGGPIGGSTYFVKYEADAVKYFPGPWETTFSVRGSTGYVHSYSGKEVPVYERYYLGGINSIRGFQTRSISPKDQATGDSIGGKSMVVFNAEFLFPLLPEQNIKGLLFFDMGNAYTGRIDLGNMKRSAGTGVRWFSPMGPLRLELGFNLDPKDGESGQEWDFTIGSAF